jgi:hypothetical protein
MEHMIAKTCPHCFCQYILGVNGTVNGCDTCENIERNPVDHTIIHAITEVIEFDEDLLTDMEKA